MKAEKNLMKENTGNNSLSCTTTERNREILERLRLKIRFSSEFAGAQLDVCTGSSDAGSNTTDGWSKDGSDEK